jgi:hypothetical protein
MLICLGRHTVTGGLRASGRQFEDWSGSYRLFSESRFEPEALFRVIRRGVEDFLPPGSPLVAAMDDSALRKTGKRIPGVGRVRDPMSPSFHVNLIWAQRILQISGAIPPQSPELPARMIPLAFQDCPKPKKPGRKAPPEVWTAWKQAVRDSRISLAGAGQLRKLRAELDAEPSGRSRPLWVCVDGKFTNQTVLQSLPARTILIGRIRKDSKFYFPPEPEPGRRVGRKRRYGRRAPTPKALLQNPELPWQTCELFIAGRRRQLKFKTLGPLLWRVAGPNRSLRLVVIAPLDYRFGKAPRRLRRQPAYLICTELELPVENVLQAYLWRWDIEVNFREEKQLLGVGQAQVRNSQSVEKAPAFSVAAYGLLLLAAAKVFGVNGPTNLLPPPKWYAQKSQPRATTPELINHLRAEIWGQCHVKN